MFPTGTAQKHTEAFAQVSNFKPIFRAFLSGLVLTLSFAPFHFPIAALLSLALFYAQLTKEKNASVFLIGLFFGLGYFGLGTSWVFVSIHEYGNLNSILAGGITLIFLLYLSLFPALMAWVFRRLVISNSNIYCCLLFSALWVIFEYFRSYLFSGFPWLLVGFGQFDSPTKYLLPIMGVYGLSFLTTFAATLLAQSAQQALKKRFLYLSALVFLLLAPSLLKPINWAKESSKAISVGIIQANLSMRDKWDDGLFWQLLERYEKGTEQLLGTQVIVMPESAIPLPPSYIVDFLTSMHQRAKQAGSAVLLGIPKPSTVEEDSFYNALISLGRANGSYSKQHLVPFGEYIPRLFGSISNWLAIPEANLKPGFGQQNLVTVQKHPIATLICYELAYGELLRKQLPTAKWIVSISDDGWFGHSFAMYQHLQMAQVRSLESARYQVVANNAGLSSVIDTHGEIKAVLPAFEAGILKTVLYPALGMTPWVYLGNSPILLFCALIVLAYSAYRIFKPKLNA